LATVTANTKGGKSLMGLSTTSTAPRCPTEMYVRTASTIISAAAAAHTALQPMCRRRGAADSAAWSRRAGDPLEIAGLTALMGEGRLSIQHAFRSNPKLILTGG
jgi:hypothetical protein